MAIAHSLTPDFQLFLDIVYGANIFNLNWLVYIIIIAMTILIITRNTERFGILLLPVITMYAMANITTIGAVFYALITLSAFVYAIKTISMQHAGAVFKAVAKTITFKRKRKPDQNTDQKVFEQYKDKKFLERIKTWKQFNKQDVPQELDQKIVDAAYGPGYVSVDDFLKKKRDKQNDVTNY